MRTSVHGRFAHRLDRRASRSALVVVVAASSCAFAFAFVAGCTLSAPPSPETQQPFDDPSPDDTQGDDPIYSPATTARDAGPDAKPATQPRDAGPDTDADAAPPIDAGPKPIDGDVQVARDPRLFGNWVPARPTSTSADWFKLFGADGTFGERIGSNWFGTWTPGNKANRIIIDSSLLDSTSSTVFRDYCVFAIGTTGNDMAIRCSDTAYPADSTVEVSADLPGFWGRK